MKHKNIPNKRPGAGKKANEKENKGYGWHLFAILALTFAAFAASLPNEFVNLDDNVYGPEQNYLLKSFAWDNIKAIFSTPVAGNYHPLTILSLAVNYAISGFSTRGYHFTNLLLHVGTTAITFFFFYRLYKGKNKLWIAAGVALLFGIHPMHAESVVWISERKDVLYAFFFMGALLVYLNYTETTDSRKRTRSYLLSLFLFVLSLLSKGQAVTLTVAIVLVDIYKGRKWNRGAVLEKIPFLILSIAFGLIAIWAQHDVGGIHEETVAKNYSVWERVMFSSYALWAYLWKSIFPVNLAAYHPYPPAVGTYPFIFYASPFIIVAVAAGVILSYLKFKAHRKLILFGTLFFLSNIVLLLQIVSVGVAIMAERYTYIAYIGIFFIGVVLLNEYLSGKTAKTAAIVVLVIYGGFLWVTAYNQNAEWTNSKVLWTNVMEKYPDCSSPYGHLATLYIKEQKPDSAVPNLTKCIELLEKEPLLHHNKAAAYVDRAYAYLQMQMRREAIMDCDSALKNDSNFMYAYVRRGIAHGMLRESQAAMSDFVKWLELDSTASGKARALLNIGNVYGFEGQKDSAMAMYARALQLDNNFQAALFNKSVLDTARNAPRDLLWTTEN